MVARRGGFTLVEVLIVLAIVGLILLAVFEAIPRARDSQRRQQAHSELNSIVVAAGTAQTYFGKPLRLVTGSGCSDCVCRAPALMTDASCVNNWTNAINKIGLGGYDISNLSTDPWGDPYGLDENEGEMGPTDCRLDSITSAGPDGVLATSDDITLHIPLRAKPCPPTI